MCGNKLGIFVVVVDAAGCLLNVAGVSPVGISMMDFEAFKASNFSQTYNTYGHAHTLTYQVHLYVVHVGINHLGI